MLQEVDAPQHLYRVVLRSSEGTVDRSVEFVNSGLSEAIYAAERMGGDVEIELIKDGERIGSLTRSDPESYWVLIR